VSRRTSAPSIRVGMMVGFGRAGSAAALAACVLAAGCSGGHTQHSSTRPAPVALSSAPTPSVAPYVTASPTLPDGEAINLPASPQLRAELRSVYVAALRNVRPDEIAGPRRGTLYYAFYPRTGMYWAIAWFDPSPNASYKTQVELQDGMTGAVFTRGAGTDVWRASVHERANLPCPGEVPRAVLRAWAIHAQSCTI